MFALYSPPNTDTIRTSDDNLPQDGHDNYSMSRWELGTQNFEAIAGVEAAIDYIAGLGDRFGGVRHPVFEGSGLKGDGGVFPCVTEPTRRQRIEAGWAVVGAHEDAMKKQFLEGAAHIDGLTIFGIEDVERRGERTSTFALRKDGWDDPDLLTQTLVKEKKIFCTSGNHYCTFWDDVFEGAGATNDAGAVRLGFLHYNTHEEVDTVLDALDTL